MIGMERQKDFPEKRKINLKETVLKQEQWKYYLLILYYEIVLILKAIQPTAQMFLIYMGGY